MSQEEDDRKEKVEDAVVKTAIGATGAAIGGVMGVMTGIPGGKEVGAIIGAVFGAALGQKAVDSDRETEEKFPVYETFRL